MERPVRRFTGWTLAVVVATALAGALTLGTALGFPLWHYNVALLALAAAAVPLWPFLGRRRVVTLVMLYAAILATGTGFVMLYTKQFAYKEWLTWWHSVTSFAFMGLFLLHWAHNHARLGIFTRRLLGRDRALGWPTAGAWTLALGAGALTWAPPARAGFTSENYLYLSSWAILVGVAFTYGLWLAFRWPALRARLAERAFRARTRALVDTSLWLSCWLALLTGIALLYFADFLRGGDLKYVSKWWHTATSVAFVAFVALHVGFNARLVAAHARRVDEEMA